MELPKKAAKGSWRISARPAAAAHSRDRLDRLAVHKAVLEAKDLHVDGFMTKPVSWEQFIGVVKSLRRSWLESLVLPPAKQ